MSTKLKAFLAIAVIGATAIGILALRNSIPSTKKEEPSVLTKLPPDLHYLIEPVLRCRCGSEEAVFAYLDSASPQQMKELAAVAARVLERGDYHAVQRFLDEYPITKHQESAELYFFFGLLDYGGFKFDHVPGK